MKKKLLSIILFAMAGFTSMAQKVDFAGPSNYGITSYNIDPTNGFTIEYWVYLNNLINFNGTVSQGTGNMPGPIDVYINGGGTMTVFYGNGSSVSGGGNASYSFAAKTWYHVAHTYNPTTNSGKLYVNGTAITTFTGMGPVVSSNSAFYLATRDDGATNADIQMKDLRIWAGEKTPTLSACLIGNETDLLVYYKMDEGSGTTLNDLATGDGTQNSSLAGTVNWSSLQAASSVVVSADQNPAFYGVPVTFSAAITGDLLGADYQWYKNNVMVGTNASTYIDNTPANGDSVYVTVSSSVPCLTASALSSNKVGMTLYSINFIPYTSNCYDYGNVEFCDPLYYDNGNYYYDGNGIGASNIDDAGILSTSQNDAYDGAFEVAVNDTAFTYVNQNAYIDTANNIMQTATQVISGLNVRKQLHFYKSKPIVRLNVQLSNPTSAAKTVRVNIASNFGSDSGTMLDSSSTDSAAISNNDRWIITHDQNTFPGNDPVITSVRFGPGTVASKPRFKNKPELGDDYYDDSISVTIPAHSSRYVVMFNRLDSMASDARNNASYFNNVANMVADSLFTGIDTLENIVNWSFVKPVATFTNYFTQSGCDSVAYHFSNSSANTDSVNWNFGDGSALNHSSAPAHTYAAGTYTVVLTAINANGYTNSANVVLNVTPATLDLSTSTSGPVITANQNGATYQWINCSGNTPIATETNQSYTATSTGNYAVIVSLWGCVDTSICVTINTTGLAAGANNSVKLYPNPASAQITVSMGNAEGATIEMLDAMGRAIFTETFENGSKTIDISGLSIGLYQVRILKNGEAVHTEKFIKQ